MKVLPWRPTTAMLVRRDAEEERRTERRAEQTPYVVQGFETKGNPSHRRYRRHHRYRPPPALPPATTAIAATAAIAATTATARHRRYRHHRCHRHSDSIPWFV
ncbi:hypothetical protein NHX12_001451 [Muraenolepis orangiensis]|uniref:Uncharacterized protein n=1 Tax=Muraenolepis orangiensis TaxID=630683 RepID=A0A9Q0E328_9TELE|nr:hypothetical protein NHX12_001451 [Muraenolepis orangiensis]